MKENIQQTALTKHFRALGTSISLTVFGTLDQAVLEKSADLVNHYEDVLTVNRDHSQLMSVNQAAGKFPVQVEASVYQLTKLAVEKSRANFGFNALRSCLRFFPFDSIRTRRPDHLHVRHCFGGYLLRSFHRNLSKFNC